jgi:hypothetical protein
MKIRVIIEYDVLPGGSVVLRDRRSNGFREREMNTWGGRLKRPDGVTLTPSDSRGGLGVGGLSRRLPYRAPRRPNDAHRHARQRPGGH